MNYAGETLFRKCYCVCYLFMCINKLDFFVININVECVIIDL